MSDDGTSYYYYLRDEYTVVKRRVENAIKEKETAEKLRNKYDNQIENYAQEVADWQAVLDGLAETLEEKYGETFG